MTYQGIVISMSRVSDFVNDQKEELKIQDNSIISYKPLIYQVMYNTFITKKVYVQMWKTCELFNSEPV